MVDKFVYGFCGGWFDCDVVVVCGYNVAVKWLRLHGVKVVICYLYIITGMVDICNGYTWG